MNNISIPSDILLRSVLIAISLIVLLLIYIRHLKSDVSYYKKYYDWDNKTHLTKQGCSVWDGQYHLHSLDGGKNWYAVEGDYKKGITIKGKAEEVFPGLIERDLVIKHIIKESIAKGGKWE